MFHRSRIVNLSFTVADHWSQCAESNPTFVTKKSPPSSCLFLHYLVNTNAAGLHGIRLFCISVIIEQLSSYRMGLKTNPKPSQLPNVRACELACMSGSLDFLVLCLYWVPFLVLGCYCSFWLGISGFIWSWNDDEGCWVWPRVLSHHFAVSSKITPPHHHWSTLVRNLIHYKDRIKVDQSQLCKTLNLNFS